MLRFPTIASSKLESSSPTTPHSTQSQVSKPTTTHHLLTTMASTSPRIAVAGVGSLGLPIVLALLNASYRVTVLTRSPTTSKPGLPQDNANLTFATVDYASVPSLTSALKDHLGVVSTITTASVHEQEPLIEAALAAGVQRFIPSEFGCDTTHPLVAALPVFSGKVATQKLLADAVSRSDGKFSYTLFMNVAFFDWGLKYGFLLDPKNRKATIYDGGDVEFSTTTLASIAKGIVGVFEHLEETKNKVVRVYDTVITQNKLLRIAQKLSGTSDKDWELKQGSTEENLKGGLETLQSGKASPEEIGGLMVGFIFVGLFKEGYGGDLSGKSDNELLGLKALTEKEVEDIVAGFV
jgi:NmrA-like family